MQVPSRRACGGLSISLTCYIGRTTCLTVSHPRVLLSISKRYFSGVITRHNGLVRLRGTRKNEVARCNCCTDSIHSLSARLLPSGIARAVAPALVEEVISCITLSTDLIRVYCVSITLLTTSSGNITIIGSFCLHTPLMGTFPSVAHSVQI